MFFARIKDKFSGLEFFLKRQIPQWLILVKLSEVSTSILLSLVILFLCAVAHAEDDPGYSLEMIVTASKIPLMFSDMTRSIIIIDRNDILNSPVRSVQEMLNYIAGIDLRQRGVFGVQSDVSVRGGSSEQTLILIDGLKINDPQTGHHNLDLPLTLNDIERIEILKGHGSKLYGPNAFSGVINIITRKKPETTIAAQLSAGDFALLDSNLSASYTFKNTSHKLSLAKKRSHGYREDTDFNISTLFYRSAYEIGPEKLELTFGYNDKEFGAYNFYSDQFPHEFEHTITMFANSGVEIKRDKFSLTPQLYWRKHKDYFLLDRNDPEFYKNNHTTHVYGIEFQSTVLSPWGLMAIGGELGNETIDSTNLGDHERIKGGVCFEYHLDGIKKLHMVLGAFAYYYTDWNWEVWPGFDVGYPVTETCKIYGSIGKSFRVPTFTELYYDSPANMGNPDLLPERALSYETGLRWSGPGLSGNIGVFRREGKNLIDWVRETDNDPWLAKNIARVNTTGFEINGEFLPETYVHDVPLSPRLKLSYTFLDASKDTGSLESKYLLDIIRHQIVFDLHHDLFFQMRMNWKMRYKDPLLYDAYFLIDTRISWTYKQFELYFDVLNLTNSYYRELPWVEMPGRWLIGGVKFSH